MVLSRSNRDENMNFFLIPMIICEQYVRLVDTQRSLAVTVFEKVSYANDFQFGEQHRKDFMSVKDALQLMFTAGEFVIHLNVFEAAIGYD